MSDPAAPSTGPSRFDEPAVPAGGTLPASADLPLERYADPVEQWLRWEEQANLVGFRVSTEPLELTLTSVPVESLDVRRAQDLPDALARRFLRGPHVLYPKHPLNRDSRVAFFDAPASECWRARFTSSRTLAVVGAPSEPLFSVKVPTDHPHPDFVQPEKTHVRAEAEAAIRFADLIHRVDATLGPDPRLGIVKEALTVLVPETEYGFVVRDLRALQDGSHHLPALSIPWVGRQIARLHGERFDAFWGRHYAEAAGRSKALLLARYGLQYETPNPQNIMVQLDASLQPTGRLVLRDLGDTDTVMETTTPGDRPWGPMDWDILPETRNSFWAFDAAGELSVEPGILERWAALHDRAYLATLAEFFELPGPVTAPAGGGSALSALNAFARSDAGLVHLSSAFARRARR